MNAGFQELPADLPAPVDDGAADHLKGLALPGLDLASTAGGTANLAELAAGRLVAYVYPRTGTPGKPLPPGWNEIPGARGCTPQSCAYRDVANEFAAQGATLVGISAQDADEQRQFAEREHIPFPLLHDSELALAGTLRLPTFEAAGMTLYRRLTLVAEAGRVLKAFYPVFPPDRDASQVLSWLTAHPPR
jgi:peroxiredoxin